MDGFGIFAIILCILIGIGWLMNLFKLFGRQMNRGFSFGLLARIVGIFIPIIGGFVGWMNFDRAPKVPA